MHVVVHSGLALANYVTVMLSSKYLDRIEHVDERQYFAKMKVSARSRICTLYGYKSIMRIVSLFLFICGPVIPK